jgi:hypothetical protein
MWATALPPRPAGGNNRADRLFLRERLGKYQAKAGLSLGDLDREPLFGSPIFKELDPVLTASGHFGVAFGHHLLDSFEPFLVSRIGFSRGG